MTTIEWQPNDEITTSYRTIKQIQVEEYDAALMDVLAWLHSEGFTEHAQHLSHAIANGEIVSPYATELKRVNG